ncbi:MAG: hypothetical protein PHV68_08420, partial [Candidatus Gastranaerophilales bacterium]|nr:hypothetical protein [Candidatus Gastranaerophilales bacterium]
HKAFTAVCILYCCLRGWSMSFVHCCGGLHKAVDYILIPKEGYIYSKLCVLDCCPVCNHTVAVVHRIDASSNYSSFRKTNSKAKKLISALKSSILRKDFNFNSSRKSNNYLNFNYFGSVQKCFSSLSNLSCGLSDPYEALNIIQNNQKKLL